MSNSFDKTFATLCASARQRVLNRICALEAGVQHYKNFSRWCKATNQPASMAIFADETAIPMYELEIALQNESLGLIQHALAVGCQQIVTEEQNG